MKRDSFVRKYQRSLSVLPAPGDGCHPALLGVANYGVLAGIEPQQIFCDIQECLKSGNRVVQDREIQDAIIRAVADHSDRTAESLLHISKNIKENSHDGQAILRFIIGKAEFCNERDLADLSPIPIPEDPSLHPGLFLEAMYLPTDLNFIADSTDPGIMNSNIKTTAAWLDHFNNEGRTAPFIIVNPLNGLPAIKKSGGGSTFRGDANVECFRYCIVEHDNLNYEDQLRFWAAVDLPVAALVYSGGKSIHGWIDIQKIASVTSHDQWNFQIKDRLYKQCLIPMGFDPACKNPTRLSRLPGHFREEKNQYQRLLWLRGRW
ncbi:hypothetical protein ACJ77P_12320 [Syntrophus buswellii]|uniref:hypothetical protein n=1 Tax=Syntrophus buswellii TaxID=43774 RepID=UPI0038D386B0